MRPLFLFVIIEIPRNMSNDIETIANIVRPIVSRYSSAGAVYLFGSRATGNANARSDYDIAVYIDENDVIKRNEILYKLSGEIARALRSDDIDIHSLRDLQAPELKYQIITQGKVIFEREPFRLIFEPRILNEYFDFLYLLRKYHLTQV